METAERKVIDCRWFSQAPEDCTLQISGRESEVLDAACEHAVKSHGHKEGPELRAELAALIRDA